MDTIRIVDWDGNTQTLPLGDGIGYSFVRQSTYDTPYEGSGKEGVLNVLATALSHVVADGAFSAYSDSAWAYQKDRKTILREERQALQHMEAMEEAVDNQVRLGATPEDPVYQRKQEWLDDARLAVVRLGRTLDELDILLILATQMDTINNQVRTKTFDPSHPVPSQYARAVRLLSDSNETTYGAMVAGLIYRIGKEHKLTRMNFTRY